MPHLHGGGGEVAAAQQRVSAGPLHPGGQPAVGGREDTETLPHPGAGEWEGGQTATPRPGQSGRVLDIHGHKMGFLC